MSADNKSQYLEFIQSVISRLGSNSFQIKGITVAVVTALVAVYAAVENVLYIYLAIMFSVIMLGLDAYYLRLERKYIALFDDVSGLTIPPKKTVVLYDMDVKEYKGKAILWFRVMTSPSILIFYLPVIAVLALIFVFCH